jgi:imidazolonepropionase-like amidohydrolase
MNTPWFVRGEGIPEGGAVEFWVDDGGNLSTGSVAAAEPLPGRYVLAGLVDAHVHVALDTAEWRRPPGDHDLIVENLHAHLAAGVLLARDVGAPVGVRVGGDHAQGPRVLAAGRFLAPADRYLFGLFEPTPADALVSTALAELAANGSGWVKLVFDFPEHFAGPESFPSAVPNYDSEVLAVLCAAVHSAGGRVAAHVSGRGDCTAAIHAGVDSIEHGIDLSDDDLAALAAGGRAWTPTLTTVWGALRAAPGAEALGEHLRYSLARAAELGVTVLAGTDANPHGTIADEVALLAEMGLSPIAALSAASSRAREFLGVPAWAPGMPADVVTYDADPRTDLTVLHRPAAVIRRGRRVV